MTHLRLAGRGISAFRAPGRPGRLAALLVGLLAFSGTAAAQSTGTLRGRVIERGNEAPIPGVQIQVTAGTSRVSALTSQDGRYSLSTVPSGPVSVRAVRIGYAPVTQTATVTAGGEVVLDFTLEPTVVQLEEVVTTATGEQSRREVGNVVATLKVDSLVSRSPVTSVADVLNARTAGVQVVQGAGQTGSSPSIRIRGSSSLSLTNEPLFIVDGVRMDNSPQPGGTTISSQRVNRLGTFNPDEIESLDVIKGPSAAALYGTAAANGVIVIKTKRGRAGRTQWSAYAEGGQVSQPGQFFDNYRSWGRNVVGGVPQAAAIQCRISQQALGNCIIDSLTTFNPLMNKETTPFSTQPRTMFGVQASGGSDRFRFFVSAEREDETGPYEMPEAEIARLTTIRGKTPIDEHIHPNKLGQTSLRGNFSVGLTPTLDLTIATGYLNRQLRTPFDGGYFAGLSFQSYFAPGFRTAFNGMSAQHVGDILSVEQWMRDQRLTTSSTLNWTPNSWLSGRAVIGMDQTQGYGYRFARFGEGTITGWGPPAQTGGKDVNRNTYSRYSVDLGATASWDVNQSISAKTAVGVQWFKDTQYQTLAQGYSLPPGATTPNAASIRTAGEFTEENATYGGYVEQTFGIKERLFLTGGVRTDQNSAFGSNIGNTIYPRAALSYVISDESWFPEITPGGNVRLRAAFGRAGVQPTTIAALQFLNAFTVPIDGVETPGLRIAALGNADLKPEVTTEVEAGIDAGFFNERILLELTYFTKTSKDALVQQPLPPSFGAGATQWQNLAKVRNRGFEVSVNADVIRAKPLSWNLNVTASSIKNLLVDAGGAALAETQGQRNTVGYPLFGLWDRPILGWNDANNDGILVDSEIEVGTTAVFRGPTLPTREGAMTNTIGFFDQKVRLVGLVDYRGGHYNQWGFENQRCASGNCRAVNDPSTPLADQAAALARNSGAFGNSTWGYFVQNDFIRLRELSLSVDVPTSVTRKIGFGSANVVLSGRNLGTLWTKYPGIDPETNAVAQNTGGGNNDYYAPPPARYWLLRVNLGF